jgi:hypothetical protein
MNRTLDQINQAIRDNPLAAGLIGVGLFMTFFGSAGIPKLTAKLPAAAKGAARAATDGIAAGASSVASAASAASSKVGAVASSLTDQAPPLVPNVDTGKLSERAGEMAAGLKNDLSENAEYMRDRVRTAAQSGWGASAALRGQFAEKIEQQPLLLGAIGLAIGAGLASVLPASEAERELMGDKATVLRDEVANRASGVVKEVKEEVAAQGLTPAGAKDALQDVAKRAWTAASAAKDKVANPSS